MSSKGGTKYATICENQILVRDCLPGSDRILDAIAQKLPTNIRRVLQLSVEAIQNVLPRPIPESR